MSNMFLFSYYVLWGVVVLQSLLILVALRQIGILHLRIAPTGARVLATGPEIGKVAPHTILRDIEFPGWQIEMSAAMDIDLLFIFISPRCSACESLLPAIRTLVRESSMDLIWAIVGSGSSDSCSAFRKRHALHDLLFACSSDVHSAFKVGVTPYAVLIRKDGVVLSKGLVNQIEHLESILGTRHKRSSSPMISVPVA